MPVQRAVRWAPVALVALLLTGCVTRNDHELVVIQLDATRAALSDQQAACRQAQDEAQARLAQLESDLHDALVNAQASSTHAGAVQAELDALNERYATLLREASRPQPPPPPPPPKRRRGQPPEPVPEPEPLPPLIQAEVETMLQALALLAEQREHEAVQASNHVTTQQAFAALEAEGWVSIHQDEEASVIRIPAAKLYQDGSVALSERGRDILTRTAAALDTLHGRSIELEGHTDTHPFHSAQLASNWELGFARAVLALRFLKELGVDQPAHASSWADTRPVFPQDNPEEDRANARVELWIRPIPLTALPQPQDTPEPAPSAPDATPSSTNTPPASDAPPPADAAPTPSTIETTTP